MIFRTLIAILLMAPIAWAHTPIGEKKWDVGNGRHGLHLNAGFFNYDSLGTWREIDLNLHVNRAGFIVNWSNILKTTIDSSGVVVVTYTHDGIDYTATQELKFLRFYRKSDSAYSTIDNTPNWNNISIVGNVVTWTNVFSAVDYTLTIGPATVISTIYYKFPFLDSMEVLLGQRPDSNDIYLANISEYTLSASIDGYDQHLGDVRKRQFKQWGKRVFGLGKEWLRYPGWDTPGVDEIPVWQRHAIISNRLFVGEFVKCQPVRDVHVANPTATISHNANITLDETDATDSYGYEFAPTTNYGSDELIVTGDINFLDRRAYLRFDVSAIPAGSNIDSVNLHLLRSQPNTIQQLYFAPIATEWTEAEVSWDTAKSTVAWTTAGGDFDSCSGAWCDSLDDKGAAEFIEHIYSYGGDGEGLTEIVQGWLDVKNAGIFIYTPYAAVFDIGSSENSTAAYRSDMYVEYTPSAAVASPRRRKISKVLGGYIDEKSDDITLVSAMVK